MRCLREVDEQVIIIMMVIDAILAVEVRNILIAEVVDAEVV
jgi:uncharacterized MnhB-related membrane protein